MSNTSKKCTNTFCGKKGVIPIYFRNDDRSFRVAFYVCKMCNEFTGFAKIDGHLRLPFLLKLPDGMIIVRLVKEKKGDAKDPAINSNRKSILQIKKSKEPCFECTKTKYEKLFVRNDRTEYHFVGYVCKVCKVIYLINKDPFKLKNIKSELYEELCLPRNPEIPQSEFLGIYTIWNTNMKSKTEDISITIKRKDIPRLKKLLKKHKIEISSSSFELTPLFERLHN